MSYWKLRITLCALALTACSLRAAPLFDAVTFFHEIKAVPRESAQRMLPFDSTNDFENSEALKELLVFSLTRIQRSLQDDISAKGPISDRLSRDRGFINRVFAVLIDRFQHQGAGFLSIRTKVPYTESRLIVAGIAARSGALDQKAADVIFMDSRLLDLYWQDPLFWDGEILRGLIFKLMQETEMAFMFRAAYWRLNTSSSANPLIAEALQFYEQHPYLTNAKAWKAYEVDHRGFKESDSFKPAQDFIGLMAEPTLAKVQARLQKEFIEPYRQVWKDFSTQLSEGKFNRDLWSRALIFYSVAGYGDSVSGAMASDFKAEADELKSALRTSFRELAEIRSAMADVMRQESFRDFLRAHSALPDCLAEISEVAPESAAIKADFESFKTDALSIPKLSQLMLKGSNASADLGDIVTYALHSVEQNLERSRNDLPDDSRGAVVEALTKIKRIFKTSALLALSGKLSVIVIPHQSDRFKDLIGTAFSTQSLERSSTHLLLNKGLSKRYWESPIYYEGEFIRNLAMLSGESFGEAARLRSAYWLAVGAGSTDPRIVRGIGMFNLLVKDLVRSEKSWESFARLRRGFNEEGIAPSTENILIGMLGGDAKSGAQFIQQHMIDVFEKHFSAVKADPAAAQKSGDLEYCLFYYEMADQIFSIWESVKADYVGNRAPIEERLGQLRALTVRWADFIETSEEVALLKAQFLLPDAYLNAPVNPELVEKRLEQFFHFKQSRPNCEGAAAGAS